MESFLLKETKNPHESKKIKESCGFCFGAREGI